MAGKWKPIDSAPQDGTIFDVWLGDADESDIDFYCTKGTKRSAGWYFSNGKFRPHLGLSGMMPTFVIPTHWMELPDGPQT